MRTSIATSATPDPDAAALAYEAHESIEKYLSSHPDREVRVSVDEQDAVLRLPREAVELLTVLLDHMARGRTVSMIPEDAELTTQQAADLLNVSRPFLIGLLEAGEIDFRTVGRHRRVVAADLLRYRQEDDLRRRAAADELTQLTE